MTVFKFGAVFLSRFPFPAVKERLRIHYAEHNTDMFNCPQNKNMEKYELYMARLTKKFDMNN